MAYATNKEFAERSGLGVRVVDETAGTGAGTATAVQSFDLDNDNIIAGTYTLSHAPSGSNNLLALTETTDYTLDKESGRVLTTGSGAESIGTDILYATYTYTDVLNDSVVTDLLNNATDQIDKLTGRYWGSGTSFVEYQDGRSKSGYPTTDNPYQADWDQPDQLQLKNWPVRKVDHVFFLANNLAVSKFFNNAAGDSGTFADYTDNVNSSTQAPFTLFDSTPATGDRVYLGSDNPFLGLDLNLSTDGSGTSTIDWEYYNGSDWADITETESESGVSVFTSSGKFTWSYPFGWAQNSVNSETLYWVRGTLSDGYSTDPTLATASIQDSINLVLEPRQYAFKENGVLNLIGARVPNGQLNVRLDYTYGLNSVPSYIAELAVLIASIQAYVNISGGSFDDATSYTVGSKSVTIGEVYVNIREVLSQLRKRVDEILKMIGGRGDTTAI